MKFRRIFSKTWARVGVGLLGLFSSMVHAALPTLAAPSRGGSTDDLLKIIQDYAYDFVVLGGLLVATVAFFQVASSTMRAYGQVSDGRGSMGQVAVQGGIGVILILVIVALIKLAVEIL